MNIRKKFLQLTKFTYPYGQEDMLLRFLPDSIQKDEIGNYFIKIGDSKTMFTCHLDTCTGKKEKVVHVVDKQFVRSNGTTILGADDKAGMVVLLNMIEHNIPGLYYFFIGEEVGCVGSSAAASRLDFSGYNKCISFDRRGYTSVITEQMFGDCCSDEFAEELSSQLNKHINFNFSPDPTGIYTDSASFMELIPECTNISVGYFNEHTHQESQDILFLNELCKAVLKVDWESLPIKRTPSEFSVKSYVTTKSDDNSVSFVISIDGEFGKERWRVKLKESRLAEERALIYDWIFRQECFNDFKGITWDGKTCYVDFDGLTEYIGDREELMYIIPQLEDLPVSDLTFLIQLS